MSIDRFNYPTVLAYQVQDGQALEPVRVVLGPKDAVAVIGVEQARLDRLVFDVDVAETADGKAVIEAIRRKLYPLASEKPEPPNRKADVETMAQAIYRVNILEGIANPWAMARAAYDALYAEVEKRS